MDERFSGHSEAVIWNYCNPTSIERTLKVERYFQSNYFRNKTLTRLKVKRSCRLFHAELYKWRVVHKYSAANDSFPNKSTNSVSLKHNMTFWWGVILKFTSTSCSPQDSMSCTFITTPIQMSNAISVFCPSYFHVETNELFYESKVVSSRFISVNCSFWATRWNETSWGVSFESKGLHLIWWIFVEMNKRTWRKTTSTTSMSHFIYIHFMFSDRSVGAK